MDRKKKGVEYFIISEEVHERVRGGGRRRRRRQRPLLFFLRSRQARLQVSRERESLAQRGGGHRGHKAKKKENKIEEGSSHRSSLARRPVILRVARAQHPSLRRARPPLVSHTLLPSLFVLKFFWLCFIHKYFDWFFFYFFLVTKKKEIWFKRKSETNIVLSGIRAAGNKKMAIPGRRPGR